jgi:hypothetical protein
MNVVILLLVFIGVLIAIALRVPVFVRADSNWDFRVKWLFVKIDFSSEEGEFKKVLTLFNKRIDRQKRKPSTGKKDKTKKKKSKKKKKQFPKLTRKLLMETLGDIAVKKILRVVITFCLRCVKSIRISMLKWNVGLDDFYWQGILSGVLHSIPYTENLQVRGNFEENNDFAVALKISIWRLITAAFLLILSFPYIRTYMLYRRVFLKK